jgi:hydrogenase maturation protein HypF
LIKGLVQGVGFRPFICRLAAKHGLSGEVDNRNDGVVVKVLGDLKIIDLFSNDILRFAPPASHIKSIEINARQLAEYESFTITKSKNLNNLVTEISPDIAVCRECLEDMEKDPGRIDYPFVNCTNCGPRFSIIRGLPYDRPNTTMDVFRMCPGCSREYHDILDRRFHAQPVACNSCGPVYNLINETGKLSDLKIILDEISRIIASGKTVAVKGIGGYFLMCDALNNEAVIELRYRKHRDAKPFAVMFRDIDTVRRYCFLDSEEEKEIISWQRPILILKQKTALADSVSGGLNTTGAMLPYMPVHYLMFRKLQTPAVVFTSGNISDDPIITDDEIAGQQLLPVAGTILSYNRVIHNRTDDSVIRIIDKEVSLIRRSRGFVPRPVDLKQKVEGILAIGADQKNTFCMGKGNQAIMSQFIGDMSNPSTYSFLSETIRRFTDIFRFKAEYLACDMHPDYFSSQYAEALQSEIKVPLYRIQHHHAHIASGMAENGIEDEVIGICFDGTGYGTDGNIWGGEFLIAGMKGFERYTHFDYVPMPGGEMAVKEPWRMTYSYLYKYFGENFDYFSIPLFRRINKSKLIFLKEMINTETNSPFTSGAGRLFDAVSALLGQCPSETFDSEAPMRLESAIDCDTEEFYPFQVNETINFADTLKAIVEDMSRNKIPKIAAMFHNTIAQVILETSRQIRSKTSLGRIILSGGVFQNKYLLEKTVRLLRRDRFRIHTNHQVPANDGGISLGQLVITSKLIR